MHVGVIDTGNDNDPNVYAIERSKRLTRPHFLTERFAARGAVRGTFISRARESRALSPLTFFPPLARNHIWCDGTHALNSRAWLYRFPPALPLSRREHHASADVRSREGHLAIAVRSVA